MNEAHAWDAAERAARESYAKLLAYLATRCGRLDAAEDALADAFTVALERWPHDGVPRAPEAWLLVAARHRLIDAARRDRFTQPLAERLADAAREAQHTFDCAQEIDDERLGVLFACAHPSIPLDARAPLVLQVVLGLNAARIASSFLVAPATMSQRLVRAKRKIAAAGIRLGVPPPEAMGERLDAVLAAIYATFGQGWDDPAGIDSGARGLADEAIDLGRLVAGAFPHEGEALGLLALMLYADSRRAARRDGGLYVPLDEQDPQRWNGAAIDEAETHLARAARAGRIGRYQLEAAVQSAHAVRRFGRPPDWRAIVTLYDALLQRIGSPVIALNRAVALARACSAAAGLAAIDDAARDERLLTYQPYWAARGRLLAEVGDLDGSHDAYSRAIGLAADPALRTYLARRIDALHVS